MRTISVTWETAHLYGEAWISHHRLRHRMFVERQKWAVPSYKALEYDAFDTPAATYILAIDEQQRTKGCVRLIATTRPYMVESLWPDLIDGELPRCESVWEASRFGCDHDLDARMRRRVVAALIMGCQEFGIANGISRYLGVMPARIFRLVIAANGCPVTQLGRKRRQSGHNITAAYIDVSTFALESVRRQTGVYAPVLGMQLPFAA